MPCDSVTTQSVVLTKAMPKLVEEALKSLEWNVTQSTEQYIRAYRQGMSLTWTAGTGITIRGYSNQQEHIDKITKAYSAKAVGWAAQKAGWQVKQTAENKLTISRR